jgi:hypothetical protein
MKSSTQTENCRFLVQGPKQSDREWSMFHKKITFLTLGFQGRHESAGIPRNVRKKIQINAA